MIQTKVAHRFDRLIDPSTDRTDIAVQFAFNATTVSSRDVPKMANTSTAYAPDVITAAELLHGTHVGGRPTIQARR